MCGVVRLVYTLDALMPDPLEVGGAFSVIVDHSPMPVGFTWNCGAPGHTKVFVTDLIGNALLPLPPPSPPALRDQTAGYAKGLRHPQNKHTTKAPTALNAGFPMQLPVLAATVASVLLSALAQIALKAGMNRPVVVDALTNSSPWPIALAVTTEPPVLIGLVLYGLCIIIWLFILSRIKFSLAYPFVSIGIVITMGLGFLIFGETISVTRALGGVLIIGGILVLTMG